MAYDLDLPELLKSQGWKVKIANLERVEPPHVTIIRKTTRWRFGLRQPVFLDNEPHPKEVPDELLKYIVRTDEEDPAKDIHKILCREWDRIYPENPVAGGEND